MIKQREVNFLSDLFFDDFLTCIHHHRFQSCKPSSSNENDQDHSCPDQDYSCSGCRLDAAAGAADAVELKELVLLAAKDARTISSTKNPRLFRSSRQSSDCCSSVN